MPESPKAILVRALEQDAADDLAGAEASCRELLAINPELPQALCLLGRIQRRKGNLAEARRLLQQAQRLAPDAYQLLAELGALDLAEKKPIDALVHFKRMVDLKPDRAEAHYNVAKAYQLTGEYDSALTHFRTALELGVERPHEVYTDIGSVHVMRDELEEAEGSFQRALELKQEEVPALFGLGTIRAAYGDFDAALEFYRQCMARDPEFPPAYRQLAEEKRFTSRQDEDFKTMQTLLESGGLAPLTQEKLHFALGKAHDDLGDYDAAFHHYAAANRLKKGRLPPFDREALNTYVDRIISQFAGDPPGDLVEPYAGTLVPICILGMPRSGTTLVERILARHPQVAPGGELDLVARISRSTLRSYQRPLSDVSAGEWLETRSLYLSRLQRDAGDAPFVTDKTIGNFAHLGLIRLMFAGAKVLHCRRDPLDTCLSNFFQDFAMDNYPANDLEDLAFFTKQYRRLIDHWTKVLHEGMLTVDYEQLVADQEKTTHQILDYCGLPWDPACLEFHAPQGSVSTLSRWQVRQPLYRDSLGRWKHYRQHIEPLLRAFRDDQQQPARN